MLSRVLASRNFSIYLIGSTFSLHGLWIQRVAVGWLAWELTGSEVWLGTSINALPLLQPDPFIVVNADVFTDFDFATLRRGRCDGSVMLVPNPPHHAHGDFGLTSSGAVTVTPPLLTYGGVAMFAPALFDGFEPGRRPLRPILDAAIHRGALEGFCHTGIW